jgi:hypothetical protein
MLPKYYKFEVTNDAGVTLDVNLDWLPYYVGASGVVYGTLVSGIVSNAALTSTSTSTSSAQDNSSAKNVGGHLMVTVTPSSAPSGDDRLVVSLLGSLDNTTFENIQTLNMTYGNFLDSVPLAGTSALSQLIDVF